VAAQSCLVCGAPSTSRCASCKTASYCSKEHQKRDWRSHKEYCLKIKAAGANTFDAILFPVNETNPRVVKVPYELILGSEDNPGQYHKLDTDVWFKHTPKDVRSLYIRRWGINGPALEHGLCLEYDENFGINESPLNRCVVEVTRGKAEWPWCGNILGLRMRGSSYNFYESAAVEEDLKPFVTYFDEYNKVMPELSTICSGTRRKGTQETQTRT